MLAGKKIDATKAAEDFGCSRRTVFRELQMLRAELSAARRGDSPEENIYPQEVLQLAGMAEPQEQYLAGALALATAPGKAVGIDDSWRRQAYDWHVSRLSEEFKQRLDRKLVALRPLLSLASRVPNQLESKVSLLLGAVEEDRVAEIGYESNGELQYASLCDVRVAQLAEEDWWLQAKSAATGNPVRIPVSKLVEVRLGPTTDGDRSQHKERQTRTDGPHSPGSESSTSGG